MTPPPSSPPKRRRASNRRRHGFYRSPKQDCGRSPEPGGNASVEPLSRLSPMYGDYIFLLKTMIHSARQALPENTIEAQIEVLRLVIDNTIERCPDSVTLQEARYFISIGRLANSHLTRLIGIKLFLSRPEDIVAATQQALEDLSLEIAQHEQILLRSN